MLQEDKRPPDFVMKPNPTDSATRLETDSMGGIEVPAGVYWGAETARSLVHFNIGIETMPPDNVRCQRPLWSIQASLRHLRCFVASW